MSLNIKNQRVHDLARQAAAATGRSQTSVIELALERLLREQGLDPEAAATAARIDVARAIAAEYRADPGRTDRQIRVVEDLYDAHTGLPR